MGKNVTVQTYSGYKEDERPVSFRLGERIIHVREIIDRWYEIDYHYFKILADDGKAYLLRQGVSSDTWELAKKDPHRESRKY